MKTLLRKYNGMSFRNRLLFSFLAFAIIPVLIISLTSYQLITKYVIDMTIHSSEQVVQKVTDELNVIFSDMEQIPQMIAIDPFFQETLRKEYAERTDTYSDKFEGDARLSSINRYKSEIAGIYVICDNGNMFRSEYFSFVTESPNSMPIFDYVKKAEKPIWLPPEKGSHFVVTTGENLITYATQLIDLANGLTRGIIAVEIREDIIKQRISVSLGKSGFIYIIDGKNEIIISNNTEALIVNQKVEDLNMDEESNQTIDLDGYPLVMKTKLDSSDWSVVGVIPNKDFWEIRLAIMLTIGFASIFTLFLAFFLAYKLAETEMKPIRKMMEMIKKVKGGDFSAQMEISRYDEIGLLGGSFNEMVRTTKVLMDKVYDDQRRLRLSEFKALQAQINPHFLYNTLDSIAWLAREKNHDSVIKMVMALSKFFKIGISSGEDIITIQEEIEHVRSYLTILNIRYQNKFTYQIDLPSHLKNFLILKLLLQPVVENAVYHGVKQKNVMGHIDIIVTESNSEVLIQVNDNGIGMSQEKLNELRTSIKNGSTHRKKSDSYGLVNIDERIKIIFGQEYGIELDSAEGVGTKVRIAIPKKMGENEEC